ncbi:MAG: lysozyme inhibitor LprI family protein, partial [Gemmatirosa sp.]
ADAPDPPPPPPVSAPAPVSAAPRSAWVLDETPTMAMPVGGGQEPATSAVPAPRMPWREPAPRRVRRPLAIGAGIATLLLLLVFVVTQGAGRRADADAAAPVAVDSAARDGGLDSLLEVASGSGVPASPRRDSTPAPAAPTTPRRARTLAERCRSPLSADQRSCLMGQLERTDARLTRVYQGVIVSYRRAAGGAREPATVRALRAEQRAWLMERDRVCRNRTRATEGTLWGAARLPCFEQMANRRADALAARMPSAQVATPRRRVGTGEVY